MATKARGPVPHHRVDAVLHRRAKKKADQMGWSMSQVAAWGLDTYLADLSPEKLAGLTERAKKVTAPPQKTKHELPPDVATQVRRLRDDRDTRYSSYVAALYDAGWSLQAIADAAGVTRQSIHERVSKAEEGVDLGGLVGVPQSPFTPVAPVRSSGKSLGDKVVDWSIWVDRDVYLAATQRARDDGQSMFEVMEDVLRRFLSPKVR